MGKKDSMAKEYMRDPVRFADAFNKYLYHGRQIIRAERLKELDAAEIAIPYGNDGKDGNNNKSEIEQRYRDVLKVVMTDGDTAYCIFGIENQSEIHYAMPVRNMLYDSLQYSRQITETARAHRKEMAETIGVYRPTAGEFLSGFYKTDRLLPVVTLVIYFGADEWDGPLSLKEMYGMTDESVIRYAPDYKINLIAPYQMSEEEINEFKTDLREVMLFHKYAKDRKKLEEVTKKDENFKHLDRQTVDVINATADTGLEYEEGKELVDVCIALEEMKEESEIKGMIKAYYEMGLPVDKIAEKVGKSMEIVMETIGISV